ncbi:MAG: hypothetical protein ACI9UQ_000646 [Candidatus Krumholzibacteriia bacterium]|jgi:hypothetical protein
MAEFIACLHPVVLFLRVSLALNEGLQFSLLITLAVSHIPDGTAIQQVPKFYHPFFRMKLKAKYTTLEMSLMMETSKVDLKL